MQRLLKCYFSEFLKYSKSYKCKKINNCELMLKNNNYTIYIYIYIYSILSSNTWAQFDPLVGNVCDDWLSWLMAQHAANLMPLLISFMF